MLGTQGRIGHLHLPQVLNRVEGTIQVEEVVDEHLACADADALTRLPAAGRGSFSSVGKRPVQGQCWRSHRVGADLPAPLGATVASGPCDAGRSALTPAVVPLFD